jgi:hypothetical protein
LLTAAECSGRRREQVAKRFNEHRRQLLQRINLTGPINNLSSWQRLISDIDSAIENLLSA